MSLLAPWFLLGGLLIGLPIWLHRLQTQSAERHEFSSAMLLENAEQQVHVRRQLKYKLLLVARILLLLLITLTFAKPLLTRSATPLTPTNAGTHLILIDTSASMGRRGVINEARALAGEAIDDAPGGALLQVISASGDIEVRSELSVDRAAHRAVIDNVSASTTRTDFGRAIAEVDRLAESLPQPVTLHFVSDFQESGLPVRFASLVPTNVATLVQHRITSGPPTNYAIDAVHESSDGIDVSISRTGVQERTTDVSLLLNDIPVATRTITDETADIVSFDGLTYVEGDNRLTIRIDADDDLAIDNSWYQVIERLPPSPVPLVSANHRGLPVLYLTAALQSDRTSAYQVEPLRIGDFDPRVLTRHRWTLIDDLGDVDVELERQVTRYVEDGGSVLAFAGETTAALQRLPVSGHQISAATTIETTNSFLSIGQIDAAHPVLSQTDGWHDVNVSQALPIQVQSNDQVLIRLENGEPMLIEQRLGQGRLLLMNAGLENRWNDLPVRPVFVSFIVEAAKYLSGAGSVAKAYTAGAVLPLALMRGASGQVIDPQGKNLLSLEDTTRAQEIRLSRPGFHEVYTSQDSYVIAVNSDARESVLQTIPDETLERWRNAVTGAAAVDTSAAPEATEAPVELWHALLFALALILLLESLLGNVYLTRRAVN